LILFIQISFLCDSYIELTLILIIIAIVSALFIVITFFAYRITNKQKKVSEGLLLNILPNETVKELKKYGKSLPKNHLEVTIMFCDVKNFSHIAETLTPEQVVEMLDTYFQQFDKITEKYGVEKIKTIGDAYMCVGGLNSDSKQAAHDTVEAAKEIIKFNESIEQKMLDKYKQAFYFRIGIHTGNVVSGVVGLKKYSYDIWGDAVNIAARMEQNSVPGKINISGKTYSYIKEGINKVIARGNIQIKNKGEIDMYFLEF
jgi:adenylate cyclase